jgi:N-ethylmaleimide reductase
MPQALKLNGPVRIAGLELPNRIIMAPLTRSRAGASGVPGPLNATYYAQRASAGMIVSEATNVGPLSCAFELAPGIWREDHVEGWRHLRRPCMPKGGRIFMQLWSGRRLERRFCQAAYRQDLRRSFNPASRLPDRQRTGQIVTLRFIPRPA